MLKKQSKNAKITLSILFLLAGFFLLSYNYFATIKKNVFNDRNLRLMETIPPLEEISELTEEEYKQYEERIENLKVEEGYQYIGYLEVPDVAIKRGFLDPSSRYNRVNYNVTVIEGSSMPDVKNGNLILAAHRGNSSVSFFDKLYKLKEGALAYIKYQGKTYTYKLKYQYTEPKDGSLTIMRNGDINTLTLITCTREDKTTQSIFIFELETE